MTDLSHATRLHSILPLAFALPLVAAAGPTFLAAQELPPAIQADRLLLQAEDQINDESYTEALRILDQILDLRAAHDLELPDGFWFKHAHVAMLADSVPKAKASVLKYLELTGQGGEHYLEALELLNATDRHLEEAETLRREAERLRIEADSQRVEDERHREELFRQAEFTSPRRVFRDCDVCPVMVEVPAGRSMIGTPAPQRYDIPNAFGDRDHEPVTIRSPFAVAVYETTFADWDACVMRRGCRGYRPEDAGFGRGRHPVLNVSWDDARRYVRWLSLETGQQYRLLTDAEWEYAARAGTQTLRYWGNGDSGQCQYENGADQTFLQTDWGRTLAEASDNLNPISCSDGSAGTAPVGALSPNPFGLYDMLGNVGEWTGTRHEDLDYRWQRGGSWASEPIALRSAYRDYWWPDYRSRYLGFRVARTLR